VLTKQYMASLDAIENKSKEYRMFTPMPRTVFGSIVGLFLIASVAAAPRVQAADKGADDKPIAAKDAVVKEYLAVQQLLANDKIEGVQTHLSKIQEAAKSVGAESQDANIKKQAAEIAKNAANEPKDLKEARKAFKPLSSAIIALVQSAPPSADAAPALY